MAVYLFGFLDDDFYGRVMVASDDTSVGALAAQLAAWSLEPERRGTLSVEDEHGTSIDPAATIRAAGLGNGDIFMVRRAEVSD